MTQKNFNNFMTNYLVDQQRRKDNAVDVQFVLDNWNNAGALANVDNKALQAAFEVQWKGLQQQTGIDDFTAKTLTAAAASSEIPSYINELNAMAINGTPESREQARNAMKALNQQKPGNLKGLSEDAENVLTMFDQARAGGQDIVQANETATKAVLDVDKSMLDTRKAAWSEYEAKFLKDKTWFDRAKSDLGLSKGVIVDQAGLGVAYKSALKSNFLSTGNIEAAKTKAKNYIMATHDYTRANGDKQFVFKPIERVLNITDRQMPFVYRQMNEQVKAQVTQFNKLYESGQSDFKYEFKESKNVSFEEYTQAQNDLKKALENTTEFKELLLGAAQARKGQVNTNAYNIAELKGKIASYEQPGLPQIQRVYKKGEPENFSLNIYASDLTAPNGMQVYDVMLKDEQGNVVDFIGANALLGRSVFFIPDEKKFRKDYLEFVETSSSGDAKAVRQMQEEFKANRRMAEEKVKQARDAEVITDNDGNVGIEDDSNG